MLPILFLSSCQKEEEDKGEVQQEIIGDFDGSLGPDLGLNLAFEQNHQPIPILDLKVELYTMPLPGVYEKVYDPSTTCQDGYTKSYLYNRLEIGFDEPTSGKRGVSALYIAINGGRKNRLEMTSVLNEEYQEYEKESVCLNGGKIIWQKPDRTDLPHLQLAADGLLTYEE
ncbi:MAG: hypothetical protein CSA97_03210 [Bacteroidetes bacterium]|nr:MAG: hypothetical protein CSA97_03210 [Bacteroidota bacterium]